MLPAQRVSTLFPYTTLFRSAYTSLRDYEKSLEYALEAEKLSSHLRSDFVHLKVLAGVAVRYHELGVNDKTLKDRKSTRLNSSHVAISYAVFCLNKQNCASQP